MTTFNPTIHTYNPKTEPDDALGDYYVSCIYGNKFVYLAGPFRNDHKAALAMVNKARREAEKMDYHAHWYAYGTCRRGIDDTKLRPGGKLNKVLGLPE